MNRTFGLSCQNRNGFPSHGELTGTFLRQKVCKKWDISTSKSVQSKVKASNIYLVCMHKYTHIYIYIYKYVYIYRYIYIYAYIYEVNIWPLLLSSATAKSSNWKKPSDVQLTRDWRPLQNIGQSLKPLGISQHSIALMGLRGRAELGYHYAERGQSLGQRMWVFFQSEQKEESDAKPLLNPFRNGCRMFIWIKWVKYLPDKNLLRRLNFNISKYFNIFQYFNDFFLNIIDRFELPSHYISYWKLFW